jgi:phosphoribosylglycinamide formyltransferase-1
MAGEAKYRIGVLASGSGTTFEAVQEAINEGELADTEIAFVICNNGINNPAARVWERAGRLKVPIFHVSNQTEGSCTLPEGSNGVVYGTISHEASQRMLTISKVRGVNMLVGLGYMKRIIGPVLQEIPIANAHRGPLPETAGKHGDEIEQAVFAQGLPASGPTLHWMDKRLDEWGLPAYDTGPIIGHEPVTVTPSMRIQWFLSHYNMVDDLRDTVMAVEKQVMPGFIHKALEELDANPPDTSI